MQLRSIVSSIIGLAAIVWAVCLVVAGHGLDLSFLAPFGITVGVVTLASVLFEKEWWKLKPLRRRMVERPDLSGTWRCNLRSSYKDEAGHPIEKVVFVAIRQTLTSMSFRMYTDKARSASLTEAISKDGTELFNLAIVYQNVPDLDSRGVDSEIHFGAAFFTHIDYDCARIEGHYWTDRNTSGTLTLMERRESLVSTYAEAAALFSTE